MPQIDLNTGLLKLGASAIVFEPISMTAMALSAIGSLVSAGGTIASGIGANTAAKYQAGQMDAAANESRAAGQRQGFEHQRQTNLGLSKLQAGAAASGAGADDPTIQALGGDMAGRGEYQALTDLYTGENRARGLQDQAAAKRQSGKDALTKSYLSAGGTILSSAGSMAGKFGGASMPGAPGDPMDIRPGEGWG